MTRGRTAWKVASHAPCLVIFCENVCREELVAMAKGMPCAVR